MTSLIMTAYAVIFVPRAMFQSIKSSPKLHDTFSGPLEMYIHPLNGSLSLLLSVNAYLLKGKSGVHEGFWLLCLLPISTRPSTLYQAI